MACIDSTLSFAPAQAFVKARQHPLQWHRHLENVNSASIVPRSMTARYERACLDGTLKARKRVILTSASLAPKRVLKYFSKKPVFMSCYLFDFSK